MNPEERSLLEFNSDDSERNSSQDELDLRRPAGPEPQTSRESSPSVTAAELHRTSVSDQQHLFASRMNPDPGLIPSCLVSPLNLMGFPPYSWVQNRLTLIPCSPFAPQTSQRPIGSFFSQAPPSRTSPCVLVPSSILPVFSWSGINLLPLFVQPAGWCQTQVPVYQTHNPAPIQSRPETELLDETVTPSSVLNKSLAGTQDEQQKPSDETEALKILKKYLKVPPGPSSSWGKKLKFEPCEDCKAALMSLCSEVTDDMGEDQRDESETTENDSFLEYLEDLCHDKNFVQTVDSILDSDFLNSLLSSDLEVPGLSGLEQQQEEQQQEEQQQEEGSSDPLPVTVTTSLPPSPLDLTSSYLNSDPLSIKSEPNRQDFNEKSQEILCHPLVETRILEEETDRLLDNVHPSYEEDRILVKTRSIACPYCCLIVDNTFTLPDDTTLTDSRPDSPATLGMQDSPSDGSCSYTRTKVIQGRGRYDKNLQLLKKGSRKQETSMAEQTPLRRSQRLLERLKKTKEKETTENMRKLGENGQIKSQLFKEEGNKKEEINPKKAARSADSSNGNGPGIRVKTGKPVNLFKKLGQIMKSTTSGAARTKAKSTAAERAEDKTKTHTKQQKARKRKLGK